MKVSICMASYNRPAAVLRRVFDSIFRQSPPFDFEVIVCDDGTPNTSTRKMCEAYPIQYHRIDRKPGHQNPCVPRNVTYRAARGDVVIAQSDEVVHVSPKSIETLVLELEGRPSSFVVATVYACGPNGRPWSTYTGPNRQVPYLFLGSLWRRDLYAVGGNDEVFAATPGYDDEWFAICLMNQLDLTPAYVPSVIGHHLYHPPRISKSQANAARKIGARRQRECKRSGVWCATGGPWPCDGPGPDHVERRFTAAYLQKAWGENPSVSGEGSTTDATLAVRMGLPILLRTYDIRSMLDIPCGDFHWMQYANLGSPLDYIGADVALPLIRENQRRYKRDFRHLNLLSSDLPRVDLVFCRDCLGHLSLADGRAALANIKRSGSKYLMATAFFNHPHNREIESGPGWTTRCLTTAPFNLPQPRFVLDEMCRESYPNFADKSMALWPMEQL
jgi:hypothetical protein